MIDTGGGGHGERAVGLGFDGAEFLFFARDGIEERRGVGSLRAEIADDDGFGVRHVGDADFTGDTGGLRAVDVGGGLGDGGLGDGGRGDGGRVDLPPRLTPRRRESASAPPSWLRCCCCYGCCCLCRNWCRFVLIKTGAQCPHFKVYYGYDFNYFK